MRDALEIIEHARNTQERKNEANEPSLIRKDAGGPATRSEAQTPPPTPTANARRLRAAYHPFQNGLTVTCHDPLMLLISRQKAPVSLRTMALNPAPQLPDGTPFLSGRRSRRCPQAVARASERAQARLRRYRWRPTTFRTGEDRP